ncbi:MAG: DUF5681 domain-containing protein [Hyphomonadaceae bacterium]
MSEPRKPGASPPTDVDAPERPPEADAEADAEAVGYRRPPRARRYPKGTSGNPRGRPKGARNLSTEIGEVLEETFPMGKRRRVSARKAILLKQREKAFQKDTPAAKLLLDLDRQREEKAQARAADAERRALDAEDKELIAAALARLVKQP